MHSYICTLFFLVLERQRGRFAPHWELCSQAKNQTWALHAQSGASLPGQLAIAKRFTIFTTNYPSSQFSHYKSYSPLFCCIFYLVNEVHLGEFNVQFPRFSRARRRPWSLPIPSGVRCRARTQKFAFSKISNFRCHTRFFIYRPISLKFLGYLRDTLNRQ